MPSPVPPLPLMAPTLQGTGRKGKTMQKMPNNGDTLSPAGADELERLRFYAKGIAELRRVKLGGAHVSVLTSG